MTRNIEKSQHTWVCKYANQINLHKRSLFRFHISGAIPDKSPFGQSTTRTVCTWTISQRFYAVIVDKQEIEVISGLLEAHLQGCFRRVHFLGTLSSMLELMISDFFIRQNYGLTYGL